MDTIVGYEAAGTNARLVILLILILLQAACSPWEEKPQVDQNALTRIGANLFGDDRLSADGRTSCATCHAPELAFADGRAVSIGAFGRKGTRNSPSLIGVKQQGVQFWDGRETSLAAAVLQPFGNPVEMGHESIPAALERIAEQPEYRAFFGDRITESDISAALTSYLLSLDGGATTFERARAENDLSQLDGAAQRGLQLFQGKAQCASCHQIDGASAFSDERFHHASVGFERIAGNIRPLQARLEQARQTGQPMGRLILVDDEIAELGRFAITSDPQDLGAFRTPNLRNVARTAPYMHDGSIQTLEAAIEHELYYRGLSTGRPISLTVKERHDLLAFLHTLNTP